MKKQIYRIEIPSTTAPGVVHKFWIGQRYDGDLVMVAKQEDAVPVTEQVQLDIMESLGRVATAYAEEDPCEHNDTMNDYCLDCGHEGSHNLADRYNEDGRDDR